MPDLVFEQFRDQNRGTAYPFVSSATLTNGEQVVPPGALIDAILYPPGSDAGMFMTSVTITPDEVTLVFGTQSSKALCSGTFSAVNPPETVELTDPQGRAAGLLVGDGPSLAVFAGWGPGTFEFTGSQTELTATVCIPQPAVGVTALTTPDGTIFSGDVWLMGADGVVLRRESVTLPGTGACWQDQVQEVIRIDVVGDPLFRRRLCQPESLFTTPRFLKTLTFKDSKQRVVVGPDGAGNVTLTVNNDLAADTVLRVHPTEAGNQIDVVGSVLSG